MNILVLFDHDPNTPMEKVGFVAIDSFHDMRFHDRESIHMTNPIVVDLNVGEDVRRQTGYYHSNSGSIVDYGIPSLVVSSLIRTVQFTLDAIADRYRLCQVSLANNTASRIKVSRLIVEFAEHGVLIG